MRKEIFLKLGASVVGGAFLLGLGVYIGKNVLSFREVRTISLSAKGEVELEADTLVLGVRVKGVALDQKTALRKLTESTKELFGALKELGIKEEQLSTRSLQVFPRYERDCVVIMQESLIYPPPKPPECPEKLKGYEASQTVYIKLPLREQDLVLRVLQTVTEREVASLWSASFEVEKIEDLKERARKKALDEILRKKSFLEKELGVRFGKVLRYTEKESGEYPFPIFYYKESMALEEFAQKVIAPERKTFSVQVTIIYELK